MSGSVGEIKAEPNLTPILDMVFQLITFFMLVINFKNEESDRRLKLPVIGSAKPVDSKGQERITVLNVTTTLDDNGDGTKTVRPAIRIFGTLYRMDKIEALIANEKESALRQSKLTEEDITTGGKELPDLVVIRADEQCPFDALDFVIHTCQKNGFRRFAFKAFRSEADQQKGVDAQGT